MPYIYAFASYSILLLASLVLVDFSLHCNFSLRLGHICNEDLKDFVPSIFVACIELHLEHLMEHGFDCLFHVRKVIRLDCSLNNKSKDEVMYFESNDANDSRLSLTSIHNVFAPKVRHQLSKFIVIYSKHVQSLFNHANQKGRVHQKALASRHGINVQINGEAKKHLGLRQGVKETAKFEAKNECKEFLFSRGPVVIDIIQNLLSKENNTGAFFVVGELHEHSPRFDDGRFVLGRQALDQTTLTLDHVSNESTEYLFPGNLVGVGEFFANLVLEHEANGFCHFGKVLGLDSERNMLFTKLGHVLD